MARSQIIQKYSYTIAMSNTSVFHKSSATDQVKWQYLRLDGRIADDANVDVGGVGAEED